ncbi:peptidase S8 [Streptomyces sp. CS227]|uniref:S53 family peptidase n=1 Tax=Streptomyces sp. CS227 TaxID=1982763 RepID=UPI000B41B3FA|nr:S53 family peptidase [Streptomyces sp. CS227]OWA10998.1 peptidase S8 [Streptomyces sp. CS227]
MGRGARARVGVALVAGAVLVAGCQGAGGEDGPERSRGAGAGEKVPGSQAPVTPAADGPDPSVRQAQEECRKEQRTSCYTFDQLRTVYGVKELKATGKGQTVAVVMPVGSPVLETDLRAFSEKLRLAAPQIEVVRHEPDSGEAAPFDWDSDVMVSQAKDTTLAVQAVHAMAPEAKVVLHQVDAAPGEADEGLTADGARRLADVARQVIEDDSADVLSVSFAVPEKGELGRELRTEFEEMAPVFLDAARKGITVVAPAGDGGAAPTEEDGEPVRGVSWPASDPSVFAVGGLRLGLDDEGRRTDPDVVWEDRAGASGGGVSEVFARPSYQNRVEPAVGDKRGVPDLSLTASGDGSTMIHFTEDGKTPSWVPMAGTSLAAPLFAGLVADADQESGDRVGRLHHHLYELGRDVDAGRKAGLLDITHGTNGDDGHRATRGYDLASGLGTLDASLLVPALTER